MKRNLPLYTATVIAVCVLGFAQSSLAADVSKELDTAALHAGLAAGAKDVKTAQTHLHHVINCLVGPKGADYDPAEANPCKGQGNGAIADVSKNKRTDLEHALSTAKSALTQSDLTKTKELAAAVQDEIKKVEK